MSNKRRLMERKSIAKGKRHSNNRGYRQIRRGKTRVQVRELAFWLGLKYKVWPQGYNPRQGE